MTATVREMPGPVTFEVITGDKWRERSLFTIDEATGLVMAETPWGTFSYYWPPAHRCENLFAFLASLDFDYFMGKAAKQEWREVDLEATLAACRKDLLEERRPWWSEMSRETARDIWDELDSLGHEHLRTVDGFMQHWHQRSALQQWRYGADVSYSMRDCGSARAFWDEHFKVLIASQAFRERAIATEHRRAA